MTVWDANLLHKILITKRKAMETALGLNVCSGNQIYLLRELDEDVSFTTKLQDQRYTIHIQQGTRSEVCLSDKFSNTDNSVTQSLINIIIKTAFRCTKMK